ncbi:hypothetical protein MPTK2_4g06810 [Marchantia polymorpha subsp. ruderalis]
MNRHSERKKVHQLGGPQNRRALPSSDLLVESVSQSVSQSVIQSSRPWQARDHIVVVRFSRYLGAHFGPSLTASSSQVRREVESILPPSGLRAFGSHGRTYGGSRLWPEKRGRAGQRREMGGAVSSIRLIAGPNRRAALQFLGRLLHVTQPAHCLDRDSARHRKEIGLL